MSQATLETPVVESEREAIAQPPRDVLADLAAIARRRIAAENEVITRIVAEDELTDEEIASVAHRAEEIRSRIDRRDSRRDAKATLAQAKVDSQRAAELEARHAELARQYTAEEARLKKLTEETLAPINAEGVMVYNELYSLSLSARQRAAPAVEVLKATAPASIQREIDRLKDQLEQLYPQWQAYSHYQSMLQHLETRLAWWQDLHGRLEAHPMRPNMPQNLSKDDQRIWNQVFRRDVGNVNEFVANLSAAIAGLRNQAELARVDLNNTPRPAPTKPIKDRIAELEAEKFTA